MILISSYSIIYSNDAIADLIEAKEWYQNISNQVYNNFKLALALSELELMKYPAAFASLNFRSFRRKIIKGFSYKLVYFIDKTNKQVIVFALIHTARSNKFIKRRLKK